MADQNRNHPKQKPSAPGARRDRPRDQDEQAKPKANDAPAGGEENAGETATGK